MDRKLVTKWKKRMDWKLIKKQHDFGHRRILVHARRVQKLDRFLVVFSLFVFLFFFDKRILDMSLYFDQKEI